MLDARRTERLTGGNDFVEFVRVEPMLGGQRGRSQAQWRMRP